MYQLKCPLPGVDIALVAFEARTDDGRLEVEVETQWRPVLDDVLE